MRALRNRQALLAAWLLGTSLLSQPAQAGTDIDTLFIWHSGTVAGTEQDCTLLLGIDSQGQAVQGMKLKLALSNGSGQVIARNEISVADFGHNESRRYGEGRWSHPAFCGGQRQLNIEQARARVLGKQFDLLARELLDIDDFKPMPMQLGQRKPSSK